MVRARSLIQKLEEGGGKRPRLPEVPREEDMAAVTVDFEHMIRDAEERLARFDAKVEGKPYSAAQERLVAMGNDIAAIDAMYQSSAAYFNNTDIPVAVAEQWDAMRRRVRAIGEDIAQWRESLQEEERVTNNLMEIERELRNLDSIVQDLFLADVGLDRPSDFVKLFPKLEAKLNALREDYKAGKEKFGDTDFLQEDFALLEKGFQKVRKSLYGAQAWFAERYPSR